MHATKYGTTYTDQEWAEKQAEFKIVDENSGKIQKMKKWAARQIDAKGLNGKYLATQMVFIDEMIEAGRIKASEDVLVWLSDLGDRYLIACEKLENVCPIG